MIAARAAITGNFFSLQGIYSGGIGVNIRDITAGFSQDGEGSLQQCKAGYDLVTGRGSWVDPVPTSAAPTTTKPHTTRPPTTKAPTTKPPTTKPPTTSPPTTKPPTTKAPTTKAPTTTLKPITRAPTTTRLPDIIIGEYGSYNYILFTAPLTRVAAEAACITRRGTLASITGPLLNEYIRTRFSFIARNFWIGLSKIAGSFKWSDGQPLSYTNWNVTQPNAIYSDTSYILEANIGTVGKWRTQASAQLPYLCKVRK